jgi:hypothetical protein
MAESFTSLTVMPPSSNSSSNEACGPVNITVSSSIHQHLRSPTDSTSTVALHHLGHSTETNVCRLHAPQCSVSVCALMPHHFPHPHNHTSSGHTHSGLCDTTPSGSFVLENVGAPTGMGLNGMEQYHTTIETHTNHGGNHGGIQIGTATESRHAHGLGHAHNVLATPAGYNGTPFPYSMADHKTHNHASPPTLQPILPSSPSVGDLPYLPDEKALGNSCGYCPYQQH